MKNCFFITVCRFHAKDKSQLIISGYYSKNQMDNNSPVIMLDDRELTYRAEEAALAPAHFKNVDGNVITKQVFLQVELPDEWESCEKLNLYNCFGEERELLWGIDVVQLREWSKNIFQNIDAVVAGEKGFRIEGWYIDTGKVEISLFDTEGNPVEAEITKVRRMDVLREFPECDESEAVGFSMQYTGKKLNKIVFHLEENGRSTDETVIIHPPRIKKAIAQTRNMYHKVKDCYRQHGIKGVFLRTGDRLTGQDYVNYDEWMRRHQPSKRVLRKQSRQILREMPKISVVVPLYKTPENYLCEMIESVRKQSYRNWELCLSDGSGEQSPIENILREYEKKDSRIRVVHNQKQLHISDNTNEALKICTGDYIAFLDHDDLLTPDAFYECVYAINEAPDTELIYSDEDKVNKDGTEYFLPHFKSDFNIDMLRSVNYFCHLVVVKRQLWQKVGMLNSKYDGAQDYDFVLRCVENTTHIKHIPKVLYHWRACEGSTAEKGSNKAYGVEAGAAAIRAHYERTGIQADVIPLEFAGMFRSKYHLNDEPLVSVIIPNKDHVEDLDKCMRSLEEKSSYANIEYIVVENNSTEEKTFAYYKELEKRNPKAKVVYWNKIGFNYPAINKFGVEHAKGDYLLFLNNDTEVINSDCIEELLGYCMREDVGAVGARLYYEDGSIQHAGVIIGYGGVAGHCFVGEPAESAGYFARIRLAQNLSAVTAACVMVKRSVFEEVGGFDEAYAVAFNDIDLCLKIRQAGHLIVYNPYAELMHYESKSRGYEDTEEKIRRFQQEIYLFRSRWMPFLEQGDPYYNPNLTLDRTDFSMKSQANKRKRNNVK